METRKLKHTTDISIENQIYLLYSKQRLVLYLSRIFVLKWNLSKNNFFEWSYDASVHLSVHQIPSENKNWFSDGIWRHQIIFLFYFIFNFWGLLLGPLGLQIDLKASDWKNIYLTDFKHHLIIYSNWSVLYLTTSPSLLIWPPYHFNWYCIHWELS